MNIFLVEKDFTEIGLIQPLWEQLNLVHLDKSVYFKSKYEKFTFKQRIESINKKAQTGIIKLDMLLDKDTENYIGYCLSSIEDNLGEIESIYIENNYRKLGLGGKLMKSSLKWFKDHQVINISIGVAYGNDEALPFYRSFGFNIANYILKK
ncbi:acetyltransferase (GNAT) family protein [Clostridium homopropionicum DSM 5847]|uniref:Acetyltransferase (GNAT) family protein n=1 Tax=Clostridium homopropionicum DSM 5847 TaxID=1121318 RepID=A0A0L6Z8X1_9CLOT|nr:GNAT family N-acetyltransferase [Clostridium homopropionicum]KOA19415.1 acetyltransferase (GNAT) family protein [Clostridium homopropionicum DSM 5847]SFG69084.1 Acetyltransferase (GNAT) family protein [Clostridium homopropionicum]